MSRITRTEILHLLLRYEPHTGKLFWKCRTHEVLQLCGQATTKRGLAIWNARYADKEAFTYIDAAGYHTGQIFNELHFAHRVIIAMTRGFWPEEVDHDNRDRSDNRELNLIPSTKKGNSKNKGMDRRNTSGFNGVHYDKRRGKWFARISIDSREKFLGYYADKMQAVSARKAADELHGFAPTHGEGLTRYVTMREDQEDIFE